MPRVGKKTEHVENHEIPDQGSYIALRPKPYKFKATKRNFLFLARPGKLEKSPAISRSDHKDDRKRERFGYE